MGKIVSINISKRKGEPKVPVQEAILRDNYGIEGDVHAGPWHRQVSILAQESIDKMIALGEPGLKPGDFAENITTQGIAVHTLAVGTKLRLGACEVEVTQIGKQCHQHCAIFHRLGTCIMPHEGIFVRVLKGGVLRPGQGIEIINSPLS